MQASIYTLRTLRFIAILALPIAVDSCISKTAMNRRERKDGSGILILFLDNHLFQFFQVSIVNIRADARCVGKL
jgi:hypothetical protein